MAVQVVAVTSGTGVLEGASAEDVISYAARVSNPSNQARFDTAARLLAYCLREKHFSVFETASMTVEIQTTRAIAEQIVRHRSFKFQIFSTRYAEAQEVLPVEARRQDSHNRQNSVDDLEEDTKQWFRNSQTLLSGAAIAVYKEALDKGIAKECARFVLPLATATTLYMTGDVRCWIHYLQLRIANGTQLEHQDIARAIQREFVKQFPIVSGALGWTASS